MKDLIKLANEIYYQCFGNLDDKYYRKEKVSEIYDWLRHGSLNGTETAEQLAEEWREYDEGNPNLD